ncbi:MAG: hypothetical protein KKG75_01970 [Nanoarchaeota archaeon]|nr:hypothetical protein [Nanoarchaeota archaeon]
MEIISKISKGSKMDQIYIPKNRTGLNIGSYVKIVQIEEEKQVIKPYFYDIKEIEPVKLEIIDKIFKIINYGAIIITGSFLEKGFNFKEIDILIITEDKINVEKKIKDEIKIDVHIVYMTEEEFKRALTIDPIWRLMLKRCISNKRLQPLPKTKPDFRYLDIQIIKSNQLIGNFNYLNGKEKYKLTRNLMAIYLFLKSKNLSKKKIDEEIEKKFKIDIEDLRDNIVSKDFLRRYKNFYSKFENEIIKNAAKQKKAS